MSCNIALTTCAAQALNNHFCGQDLHDELHDSWVLYLQDQLFPFVQEGYFSTVEQPTQVHIISPWFVVAWHCPSELRPQLMLCRFETFVAAFGQTTTAA